MCVFVGVGVGVGVYIFIHLLLSLIMCVCVCLCVCVYMYIVCLCVCVFRALSHTHIDAAKGIHMFVCMHVYNDSMQQISLKTKLMRILFTSCLVYRAGRVL